MRWLAYFAVIGFFSCASKNSIPNDILQPKQMQSVVWDLLQADELAFQNKQADTTLNLKNESFQLYDQVFAIHKINRQQYYKSYKYYQEHPGLYKSLMESVKKNAEKDKVNIQNSPH